MAEAQRTYVTSIAPWLTIRANGQSVDFYKEAFGAVEGYRMDGEDGSVVAKLLVDGAEFWLNDEPADPNADQPKSATVRMVLTVTDPDAVFARALAAGATEIFPVGEGYGWRVGRLVDPYGHHWEIGHPL